MQKNCEYCGSPFTFQRNTRKYCSDNCKQMAYFTRNGFTLANNSATISTTRSAHCVSPIVTVKDIKYSTNNDLKKGNNLEDNSANDREFEKLMEYAKCLIRNLLHLSGHQHVERDTFLEFTATWSQFVHWRSFKRAESQFSHYSLMLELETKLNALAKAHKQSDLIKISLSQELSDQLNDSMDEMEYIMNIKFNEIRF